MKKEYTRPELNVVSFVVEDITNEITLDRKDDNRLSMGDSNGLGKLFG